ncbi:restriction endonuclease subunit S [Paenibacillus sp. strain BS8-2]
MSKKVAKSQEELLKEALVPVEEQPYEVPENWVWVRLNSVVDFYSGSGFPKEYQGMTGLPIPFYKVGSLKNIDKNKYLLEPDDTIDEDTRKGIKAGLVSEDTIVFAKIGEAIKLNRRALIPKDSCIDNNLMGFRSKDTLLNNQFLYLWSIKTDFYPMAQATTVPSIRKSSFEVLEFPLPPLNEQNRIADKVERLLDKINQAKQLIEEAKATFELRRAAILDKAFRGELTMKWREGKLPLESADDWLLKNGITIKKSTGVPPFKIPKSWTWVKFSDVASVMSNLVDPLKYGNLPHIAPDNIEKGTGLLLDYVTIEEAGVKSPKHLFEEGQILYSKIRPYLSKLIIADFNGLCSADMYPISSHLNINYLYWFMLSSYFVEKASTAGSRSVLPKINQKELSEIMVPICNLNEQREIAELISKFMLKNNDALSKITDFSGGITDLEKSILSKAFTGQLGTNNSDDEDALQNLIKALQE